MLSNLAAGQSIHLCPEMLGIRRALSFDKRHEVSAKSKRKPPRCSVCVRVILYFKVRIRVTVCVSLRRRVSRTYMIFAGWEVRIVKNCDRGLEKCCPAAAGRGLRFQPRSQFFTVRTDPELANN